MKRKLFHFSPHTFLYLMVAFLLINDLFSLTKPLRTAFGAALGQASPVTVPPYLNYQGTLRDAEGKPITGAHKLTFRIYADVTAPLSGFLWTETHENVTVRDGHFSVLLGNLAPLSPAAFNSADRFIGITLDALDEMVPRQRFASVPYAFNTDMLDNLHAQDFALVGHIHNTLSAPDGNPNPAVLVNNDGQVGIGRSNPESTLDVSGSMRVSSGGGNILPTSLELRANAIEVGMTSINRSLSVYGGGTNKSILLNPTGGGQVGINTATPTVSLDVNGHVHINGTMRFGDANLPPVKIIRLVDLGADVTTVVPGVSPDDYECTVGSWSIFMDVDENGAGGFAMWAFVQTNQWKVRTRHWTNGPEKNQVDVICFLKSITQYTGDRSKLAYE